MGNFPFIKKTTMIPGLIRQNSKLTNLNNQRKTIILKKKKSQILHLTNQ